MILVHSLDVVLGNKEKLSQVSIITISLEIMHRKLLKFKHKGHCFGKHGNHNNQQHIFLSQGSSHNNIVKLQSDNIRDKK